MKKNRSILPLALSLLISTSAAGQGTQAESSAALLSQSARNLYALTGLEAEFRYQVDMFDESLSGTGSYEQLGDGPEKLFRLELRTKLEDRTATMQMICGKQYLWIRQDLGDEKKSLARVSLDKLRQAIDDSGGQLSLNPSIAWIGIVSLPKLQNTIAEWFEFGAPEQAKAGERSVLKLRGNIKSDLRNQFLNAGAKGQGGPQVPDAIEMTLGQDETLPLFPYRIEFLKNRTQRTLTGKTTTIGPMLTIDFHSAKIRSDLDPRLFDYFPGDQEVEDRTTLFLERLGLKGDK